MADQGFFTVHREWAARYPNAKAGILVMKGAAASEPSPRLDEERISIEEALREKYKGFSREQLNALPVIDAYNRYYKGFGGKTYHVRSQVESMLSGKPLSSGSPLVTAMFIAEVKNMLLTAGHDLDTLRPPVRIGIGARETFTDIRGALKKTEAGDMVMTDSEGVISSIILGPDGRSKLTSHAKNVMFATYAPADVSREDVLSHLNDIERYVKLFAPDATTELKEVFEARP